MGNKLQQTVKTELKAMALNHITKAIEYLDTYHEPFEAYREEGKALGIAEVYEALTGEKGALNPNEYTNCDVDILFEWLKLYDLSFEGTPYALLDADVEMALRSSQED